MPAPRTLVDEELGPGPRPGPEPGGRRPAWWRRAVAAVLRSAARAAGGGRRNERGVYRGLGREARQAIRERRPGDLFRG